jgi:hypothetical protein
MLPVALVRGQFRFSACICCPMLLLRPVVLARPEAGMVPLAGRSGFAWITSAMSPATLRAFAGPATLRAS